jgi:multicomponent Na+:H+ antiporter subunit B
VVPVGDAVGDWLALRTDEMIYLLELLLVFMIIAAAVAIWTRDLLSSVIAVGAVGFGSSVAFLLLRAPDVAITQIVVEVLTLVILIRATVGRDVTTVSGTRELFGSAVSGALVLMLLVFTVTAVGFLPPFGEPAVARVADAPAASYLESGLSETGSGNIVTSILLDYRGYDTLGEATVLFASIVGAVALLRRKGKVEVVD